MDRRRFLEIIGLTTIGLALGIEGEAEARRKRKKARSKQVIVTPQNKIEGDKLTLYFTTNSDTLQRNDINILRKFYREHPDSKFLVEAYCDPRGEEDFNLDLGDKRAKGVEQYLHMFKRDMKVRTVTYGESKAKGDNLRQYAQDRKAIIILDGSVFGRGLDVLPADYYLIDGSSSMQGEKWEVVSTYKYPDKSKRYVFKDSGIIPVTDFSGMSPEGGTPLWNSIGRVMKEMDSGKSLTVLTDGDDTYGTRRYTPEKIIEIAKSRNIPISMIATGVRADTRRILEDIVGQTSGKIYVENNQN
ncbi:OmpA family protein [Candidatus Woesearchaeota archaeon]|nr:OmpA family protein [Candidatus Woesearchaeota archaeon]HIH25777.1 OmpA family protein [Nanoarchaeota archaeon]